MNVKRIMRLIALALIIGLASIFPVPIVFSRKDDLPKYFVEQVDISEDEEDNELKELL